MSVGEEAVSGIAWTGATRSARVVLQFATTVALGAKLGELTRKRSGKRLEVE